MDTALSAAYETCRRMQRRHDPTYYWATRSLPGDVRPATHALYGYVRTADEIVDGPDRPASPHARRAALDAWEDELERGLAAGRSPEPVVGALVDAGLRHDLPLGELRSYMRSMRIDCAPVRIATWEELEAYMDGSAGSVGRIMASLLGVPACHHVGYGRLGLAFQLTNFIRDVREDTALDRIYLPAEERARFGVAEPDLAGEHASPELRALVAFQVRRARGLFAEAAPAVAAAPRTVRPGVRLAVGIYRRVLDRAEQVDFDVLGRRAGVRPWQLPGAAVEAVGDGTAFRQRVHPPGGGDEAVPHGTAFGQQGHPPGAGDEAVPP
jgi:phytoene synthase